MNYEQKYNEAFKRAETLIEKLESTHIKGFIYHIFPELKENKDEKIRRELIEHIKANKSADYVLFKRFSPDDVIDWLEKQNPAWSEEDEEMLNWLCCIIHTQRLDKAITIKEESELGEWIDKWLNYNPQTKQSEHLENYDEDERIRKEIVDFITSSNKYGTNERCEAWLNWLEKQSQ